MTEMKIDTTKEERLRRYLLGECTDDERQAVEERFISDDEFFDEMRAYEDELYLEYSAGEMTASERSVFEQKFLRSREDRGLLAFSDALLELTADLAKANAPVASAAEDAPPSFLQSIGAFFGLSGSAMSYGMAAAALVLAIGVIGLLVQNSRMRNDIAGIQGQNEAERRDREAQLAESQKQQQVIENQLAVELEKSSTNDDRIRELESEKTRLENEINDRRNRLDRSTNIAPPGGQSTIATLVISPGLFTRSDGKPMNRIVLARNARSLDLRLTLKNVDEYQKFGVVITSVDDDRTILTRSNLTAAGKGAKQSLKLNIPAGLLQRADYEVVLTGVTKTGGTEGITKYYFSVDR